MDKLATIQAVSEISTTAKSLIQVYREKRILSKGQQRILEEKIHAYIVHQRLSTASDLEERIYQQIVKMDAQIKNMDMSEAGRRLAFRQLEITADRLNEIAEDYFRRY